MEEKSKRPANSAFKQQRLKAWQPLLTPKTVLPAFFLIGVIFIPLGIGLYITSQQVQEIILDYTHCTSTASSNFTAASELYQWKVDRSGPEPVCTLRFEVSEDMKGPIFLYYRLTNFYQNHRRYVKSFNSDQLRGTVVPAAQLSADCTPIANVPNQDTESTLTPTVGYFPCGLIANSLFNDTFSNLTNAESGETFPFSEKGIAWPGDKKRYGKTKYGQPSDGSPPSPNITVIDVVPPPNWVKYNGSYTQANIPDLSEDEHFQVWMRTSGLPTFRKLYGKTEGDLRNGTYDIVIVDRYPVVPFDGTKSIVISTTSWMGGKNPFLGIAYLVVGSVCVALGVAFLIRHCVAPRKLGDHSYIKWK